MGKVRVGGQVVTRPGTFITERAEIILDADSQYVSRAGLKLASVASVLNLDFKDKIVLDVGSSTGGFTDYALRHDAKKIYAVDVGTQQLHQSLRGDHRVELHEKTDIRDFKMSEQPDVVVIDVSFISLQAILPAVACLCGLQTIIVAMAKPQFEAEITEVSKGVIKNDTMRRLIFKRLEAFLRGDFVIIDKADSEVAGAKGNRERFYKIALMKRKS
jgi:23S rRNA (cytidine1920-2'-O)/16S rRNA (cytidine1409-2'-O)-methyltransferase